MRSLKCACHSFEEAHLSASTLGCIACTPTRSTRSQKKNGTSERQTKSLVTQHERKRMDLSVNKLTELEEASPSALLTTCSNSLVECCGFLMYLYPFSPCHCTLSTIPRLLPLDGCTCNIRVRVKHYVHTSVKHQVNISPCLATTSEDNGDEASRLRMCMNIVKVSKLGSRVARESSFS